MFREFKEESKKVFYRVDRIVMAVILFLILLWILSGIYIVEANQVGLVKRFGALLPVQVEPGMHYHLPWPIESVDKVNIREIQVMDVGFFPPDDADPYGIMLPYCLTGDMNIIHNRYRIQYRITDPAKYKYYHVDPLSVLSNLAQSAILESVAGRDVDVALTTGKIEMAEEIRKNLQSAIEAINLGITVTNVDTRSVTVPMTVQEAFQNVISAQSDRVTAIHDAENERNRIIPEAEARANTLISAAESYKYQRVTRAQGEAERFLKLYDEYKQAPDVTKDRLFLQMVEDILPKVRVVVLATDSRGRPVKLKLFSGAMPTKPVLPE